MYAALEVLVRALAPITSFTSEEIWTAMPGRLHDSVFFATWKDLDGLFDGLKLSGEEETLIATLADLRSASQKRIEELRNEGKLGGSLEAEVALYLDAAGASRIGAAASELRFFFITSEVRVSALADAPADANSGSAAGMGFKFGVTATQHGKCVRCWHHRADVAANAGHPELCSRCVSNVEGKGETRAYF
jgi:isoleucyl-tRNA synthetase